MGSRGSLYFFVSVTLLQILANAEKPSWQCAYEAYSWPEAQCTNPAIIAAPPPICTSYLQNSAACAQEVCSKNPSCNQRCEIEKCGQKLVQEAHPDCASFIGMQALPDCLGQADTTVQLVSDDVGSYRAWLFNDFSFIVGLTGMCLIICFAASVFIKRSRRVASEALLA